MAFLDSPPWTFTSRFPARLLITDAFQHGDSFQVYDNFSLIGVTPPVAAAGACGDVPSLCWLDPGASHLEILLGKGPHSLTIVPSVVQFPGSGFFMVQQIPEPGTLALLAAGFILLCIARRRVRVVAGVLAVACAASGALPPAPDGSTPGPLATAQGFYEMPAAINSNVLVGRPTQIRARVYRPAVLNGELPLLLFLHGNHGTCGRDFDPAVDDPAMFPGNPRFDDDCAFTDTGACAAPFPIVAPSYLGYEYLALRMASHGYMVVSIDANRGITCGGGVTGDSLLIRARGRLVLEHLRMLSEWDVNGGTPGSVGAELQNHIDFSNVGFMGHSRGGEGVRAAYNIYYAGGSVWPSRILRPVTVKAIFEIAPTDNGAVEPGNTFNALGTVWNVLLPLCDADVANLQGVRPFDRMHRAFLEAPVSLPQPFQKSTFTVWGTNHNFFNTQWQISDTAGKGTCIGSGNIPLFPNSPGSPEQRLTALASLPAFFRGNVGETVANLNRVLNPLYDLPAEVFDEANNPVPLPSRIDRGFTPSPNLMFNMVVDDFNLATGISSNNVPNLRSKIGLVNGKVPDHDPNLPQRAASITWGAPGPDVYFQANLTAATDTGKDISSYVALDFRVSRQNDFLRNLGASTDFSIRLVGANGLMTRGVRADAYAQLDGPSGGFGGMHPLMKTIRIPLLDFSNLSLIERQVRGVRFTFDQSASGAIYLANVRFQSLPGTGADIGPSGPTLSQRTPVWPIVPAAAEPPPVTVRGSVVSIVRVASHPQLDGAAGVDLTITSSQRFAAADYGPILSIGSKKFHLSRFQNGNLRRLVFVIPVSAFQDLPDGVPVVVDVFGNQKRLVDCGALLKSMLR